MGLAVLLLLALAGAPQPPTFADLTREARAAYDKGDYAAFLEKTSRAAALAPGDVWVLYNVACGQALTGRRAEALRTLDALSSSTTRSTRAFSCCRRMRQTSKSSSIRRSSGARRALRCRTTAGRSTSRTTGA